LLILLFCVWEKYSQNSNAKQKMNFEILQHYKYHLINLNPFSKSI
jgi:hypothetical protein